MREIWKDIAGYEGIYQVSNLGNVKSLSFGPKNIRRSGNVKLLRQTPSNCGYYKVELYNNGKSKILYVHRLVAQTFLPNPNNKPQVNHIDGNKAHNSVDNLEWVTRSENQKHAFKTGLTKSPMKGKFGKLNPLSKKVDQYDTNGNFIKTWDSIADISRFYACSRSTISNCLNGRIKTCKGYIFKFSQN